MACVPPCARELAGLAGLPTRLQGPLQKALVEMSSLHESFAHSAALSDSSWPLLRCERGSPGAERARAGEPPHCRTNSWASCRVQPPWARCRALSATRRTAWLRWGPAARSLARPARKTYNEGQQGGKAHELSTKWPAMPEMQCCLPTANRQVIHRTQGAGTDNVSQQPEIPHKPTDAQKASPCWGALMTSRPSLATSSSLAILLLMLAASSSWCAACSEQRAAAHQGLLVLLALLQLWLGQLHGRLGAALAHVLHSLLALPHLAPLTYPPA